METLHLISQVSWEEDQFIARVEGLDVQGVGASAEEAKEQLIQNLRGWIEFQDSISQLEHMLAEAGYPGVEESTELELEFVE